MKINIFPLNIKIPLLLSITFLLALTSCESFLEEQPSTLIDSGYVYATEDGLNTGVVSLYKFERDRYDNNSGDDDYIGAVLMTAGTDLVFSRSGYVGLMGRYERTSPIERSASVHSTFFWNHYYNISNKATELINAADAIEGIEEESRNQILAEAKFFRAHAYFYLYRMYNNIFVSTETVTVENAFDVVNDKSSEEEIFAIINSDLDFAIEHLNWNDAFGRVNKGTAKHVKAKVLMWEEKWEEAKDQAVDLIENAESPHSLLSSTDQVFGGDKNHSEALFVIQSQDDLLGGGDLSMVNANYAAQYFQIPGIESNIEQGGRGFSRILPNLYLLGLLAEDENDDRDDNNYFRLKYFYTSGPRVGEQVDDYRPITDLSEDPEEVPYRLYYRRMGPSCIKFAEQDDNIDSYRNRANIMVYRLAETYLIAAEAIMRSTGDPLPYINAIRERANAAPLTSVDEQAILDERARELAFEGQRWFTLKRMGQEVIDRQITNFAGDGPFFPGNLGERDPRTNWRSHFINYPIPQSDLDLLGPGYPQNDGYE